MRSKVNSNLVDIVVRNFASRDNDSIFYNSNVVENLSLDVPGQWAVLAPMIPEEPREFLNYSRNKMAMVNIYYAKVLSSTIPMTCPSTSFQRFFLSVTQNPVAKRCLIGSDFKP